MSDRLLDYQPLDGRYIHGVEIRDVMAGVDRRFDSYPSADRRWKDPHEHSDVADEEYSRVTAPERYAVVGARAMAWVAALEDLQLATAQDVDVPSWAHIPEDARAVLVTPAGVDAVPILVVLGPMEGVADAVVTLAVGEPPVSIGTEPFCGCDACDSGSDHLLTSIDETFTTIVDGSLLYAEGNGWTLTVGVNGWSGSGSQDFEALIRRARAGASIGHRMITGGPWFP